MRISILFAAALSLPLPAMAAPHGPQGEDKLAALVRGAPPGKPKSCITAIERRDSETIEGVGVLYRNGRNFYLNRFRGGCPELHFDTILVTRTTSDLLCRGDIAQLVDNTTGAFRGTCVMDDFVPYFPTK